ncbi:hypothetical protein LB450_07480 [Psychroflexus sp. CAK1W]|uniref:hypothetical protein n=1 Tax=Psychroflexus curvus TaxID=2873595 RepID=UPI001CCE5BA3|nr:hypothetical protein [Psychroflexus curvus]MBZ9627938.1 hypothetical protein [Psychroflexus curvus]
MKIIFNKKRLYSNLMIGLVWIITGTLSLFFSDDITNWTIYAYLILGVFYLGQFFLENKNLYLLIEDGSIQEVKLFGSTHKLNLDEIQDIKKEGGEYVLKSDTKKIKIDIDLIDNAALLKLMEVLKKADLPPEKNYFSKFKTQL